MLVIADKNGFEPQRELVHPTKRLPGGKVEIGPAEESRKRGSTSRQGRLGEGVRRRNAFNFALEGDDTNQLLFRLGAGQVDGLGPKPVVLQIGMNNTLTNSAAQIAEATQACVRGYLDRCPHANVLLLAPFPRRDASDPLRAKLDYVGAILGKATLGERVNYLDIGGQSMNAAGTHRKELMPGMIHPSAQDYRVWADAIRSIVDRFKGN